MNIEIPKKIKERLTKSLQKEMTKTIKRVFENELSNVKGSLMFDFEIYGNLELKDKKKK